MAAISAAIEVEGVAERFGATVALDEVSLTVGAGQRSSRCSVRTAQGKTTLIRVLTTLLLPDTGRARVAGHDVRREAGAIRSVIGLAGQFATVDELLTGRENLEFSSGSSTTSRSRSTGVEPMRPWPG